MADNNNNNANNDDNISAGATDHVPCLEEGRSPLLLTLDVIVLDEIALYDRQIRLWGIDAQEKIRTANILLITLRGLGNEIAKNLAVSGVGSLTLLDDAQIQAKDLGAQFLISEENLQQNRALTAAAALREINPRVQLHVDPSSVDSKPPEFFGSFDLVIATDLDYNAFFTVNTACRLASKPFYAAGVHGLYGFAFADLIAHDFVIEREKSNVSSPVNETPTRTILGITTKTDNDKVIEVVTKREVYTPMILANASPLPDEYTRSPRERRNVTPLLTCLRSLWDFQRERGGTFPTFSRDDLEYFTYLSNERHLDLKLDPAVLTSEFLRSFLQNVGSEVSPTVGFLGGYVTQNVINVLSAREQPLQNFLFFDGERSHAPIYRLFPIFPDNSNGS